MAKCSFCTNLLSEGTGKLVIQKTGKMNYFCSSKCERNLLILGRDPRKFKWTGKREKNAK
jgi:large subunit ribosomal protein L24e